MADDRTALGGLRAVEFGHGRANALVGMVLADFGASVVAVRPPKSILTANNAEPPLAARQWDRGKTVMELDLRQPHQLHQAVRLVARADIVVDGLRAGALEQYGLGYEGLRGSRPDLVYGTIRGSEDAAGERGLRGRDATVLAATGRMHDMGELLGWDRPAYIPIPMLSFGAAQGLIQGILAALHERRHSGLGQHVGASLARSVTPYDVGTWLAIQFPEVARSAATASARGSETPYMGYLTARGSDGRWIQFANWAPRLFWAQLAALGSDDLRADPRFAGLPFVATEEAFTELWEQVLERVATRPAAEWVEIARTTHDFGVELFRSGGEGMDHPQVRHNGDVVEVRDSAGTISLQLGPIAAMSSTPARIEGFQGQLSRAPLDVRPSPPGRETDPARPRTGALADVTVLEFATMLAGPFGPSLLAEQGARVIKVEPVTGDPMRQNPLYGVKTQQGKESLALDLKAPEAADLVHRLASQADVIVENFRPGVATRLGVGWEQLRSINPQLIYVHAAGYGPDGPYAGMPAYHPTPGAICGNAVLQAGAGFPPPHDTPLDLAARKSVSHRLAYANEGHPDSVSALVVATAALLGLAARDQHGCGQEITTSMLASNGYLMSEEWIRVGEATGTTVQPDAGLHGINALRRLYQCAHGWVFLECVTDGEWDALRSAMPGTALDDNARFGSRLARDRHDAELQALLSEAFAARTAGTWETDLANVGVPCVHADRGSFAQLLAKDKTLRSQEIVVDTEHPTHGRHWRHGALIRLSRTPGPLGPGTLVGQHTREILTEVGLSGEEIADLYDRSIVTWPTAG